MRGDQRRPQARPDAALMVDGHEHRVVDLRRRADADRSAPTRAAPARTGSGSGRRGASQGRAADHRPPAPIHATRGRPDSTARTAPRGCRSIPALPSAISRRMVRKSPSQRRFWKTDSRRPAGLAASISRSASATVHGDRLVDDDVPAGRERLDRDRDVESVWRRHDDEVDVGAAEQLVDACRRPRVPGCSAAARAARSGVRRGDGAPGAARRRPR